MSIFSGDKSRDFWKSINSIQYQEVKDALYWMGCKMQELESEVERLKMKKTSDNKTQVKASKKFKENNKPTKTGKDNRLVKKS